MGVNYIPNMEGYTNQGQFRYWCQTVLPLVYDDSLSYYELLNKVVYYLNNVISDVSAVETNVDSLLNAYSELQTYVNDYFDNLNVQNEINAKLDAMAESGELTEIISPFIPNLVSAWLAEHITPTTPAVDDTLSIAGAAADSKTVGDIFKTGIMLRRNLSSDDIITTAEGVERTVTATGYYPIVSTSVGTALFGIASTGNFFIFKTAVGGTAQELAIFNNGIVLMRYGASGDFVKANIDIDTTLSHIGQAADAKSVGDMFDKTIVFKRALETTDIISGADRTVTDTGYYTMSISVSEALFGVHAYGVFYNIKTGDSATIEQLAVFTNGDIKVRYGYTGDFINSNVYIDNALSNAGEAADAKVVGDNFAKTIINRGALSYTENVNKSTGITESGYWVSAQGATAYFIGLSEYAVFINYTTLSTNALIQLFITASGKIFTRYGDSGEFKNFPEENYNGKLLYYASNNVTTTASDGGSGAFVFYIPYGKEKHIRIKLIGAYGDTSNVYPNKLLFRLSEGTVGHFSNGSFIAEKYVLTDGDVESAYYINNSGYAIGNFHGWEVIKDIKIFVDNKLIYDKNLPRVYQDYGITNDEITTYYRTYGSVILPQNVTAAKAFFDIPNIELTECKNIEIIYSGTVYNRNSYNLLNTQYSIIEADRKYTISEQGIYLDMDNEWLISGHHGMMSGMGNYDKRYAYYAVTDADNKVYSLYDTVNDELVDVNTPISSLGVTDRNKNISRIKVFSEQLTEDNTATADYDNIGLEVYPPCDFWMSNLNPSRTANKAYFRYHKDTAINEVWHNQAWHTFCNNFDIKTTKLNESKQDKTLKEQAVTLTEVTGLFLYVNRNTNAISVGTSASYKYGKVNITNEKQLKVSGGYSHGNSSTTIPNPYGEGTVSAYSQVTEIPLALFCYEYETEEGGGTVTVRKYIDRVAMQALPIANDASTLYSEDVIIDVPELANVCYINSRTASAAPLSASGLYLTDINNEIVNIEDNIDIINNSITVITNNLSNKQDKQYTYDTKAIPNTDRVDTLFSSTQNNYVEYESTPIYHADDYTVNSGEHYKVIGVQPSNQYRLWCVRNTNGDIIAKSDSSLTGTGAKEDYLVIPENGVELIVNGRQGTIDAYSGTYVKNIIDYIDQKESVEHKRFKVTLSITQDKKTIDVVDGNFLFRWGNHGANNLPNLARYYYNNVAFFTSTTDWIGPYDFNAVTVSDITGTRNDPTVSPYITSSNTTGGNHAFIYDDGTNVINYRSAKNNSLDFYFDNIKSEYDEIGTYEIYCDNVKAMWCNDVCAGNTVKINPDNPSVLNGETPITEYGYADFMGNGVINVGVIFNVNEPIQMRWYSGLQMSNQGITGDSRSYYIPDITNDMIPYDSTYTSYSVGNKVTRADFIGNNLAIEMYMNRDYGIGKNVLTTRYFHWSENKAYMELFDKRSETPSSYDTLNSGVYSWNGYYRFYPTNLNELLIE